MQRLLAKQRVAAAAPGPPTRTLKLRLSQVIEGLNLKGQQSKRADGKEQWAGANADNLVLVVVEGDNLQVDVEKVTILFGVPADRPNEAAASMLKAQLVVANAVPGWTGMLEFYSANAPLVRDGKIDWVITKANGKLIELACLREVGAYKLVVTAGD